jgi:hypothetical protein
VIGQGIAHQTKSNGVKDHGWNPQGVETVLGLPDASVAGAYCQREAVADKVSIDKSEADSDPMNERNYLFC